MGERITYNCICGYTTTKDVGGGMQAINLRMIERLVPGDVFQEFIQTKEAGGIRNFLLENGLAECSCCKELVTVPYFHYETIDGRKVEYIGVCPTCKDEVSLLERPYQVKCPHCGSEMRYAQTGDWD